MTPPAPPSATEAEGRLSHLVVTAWEALVDPSPFAPGPDTTVRDLLGRVDVNWTDDRTAWTIVVPLVSYAREHATRGGPAAAMAYSTSLALYDEVRRSCVRSTGKRSAKSAAAA